MSATTRSTETLTASAISLGRTAFEPLLQRPDEGDDEQRESHRGEHRLPLPAGLRPRPRWRSSPGPSCGVRALVMAILLGGLRRHTCCSNSSRSSDDRLPRSSPCRAMERLRGLAALVAQHGEEGGLGVELGGIAELGHRCRWRCDGCACRPSARTRRLLEAVSCRSRAIMRSSFRRTALKDTSLSRLRMSRAVRGSVHAARSG